MLILLVFILVLLTKIGHLVFSYKKMFVYFYPNNKNPLSHVQYRPRKETVRGKEILGKEREKELPSFQL